MRESKAYNQQLNIPAMRFLLDHFRYLVISSNNLFFKPNQVQWKMYVGRPGLVDPAQLENAFLVFSTSMRIQLCHYHGEANTTKQTSPIPTFNWSPSSQLVTHTHTQSSLAVPVYWSPSQFLVGLAENGCFGGKLSKHKLPL